MHIKSLLLSALANVVIAKLIDIKVSNDEKQLVFDPASVQADQGDTVQFYCKSTFSSRLFETDRSTVYPNSHNVVQGSFNTPCQPLAGGFFSGSVSTSAGPANTTFIIKIDNVNPIWFYCSVGKHCQGGMAGVINPPS